VIAVFQGHSHQNDLNTIGGIHYCTLVAMVEGRGLANNAFSILNIDKQGSIQLTGFQKQKSRQFA
jgi:alkaline phosphatase